MLAALPISTSSYAIVAESWYAVAQRRERRLGFDRVRWTKGQAPAHCHTPTDPTTDHRIVDMRFARVLGRFWEDDARAPMPKTRAECPTGTCRHYLCRWHLSVEGTRLGSLSLNHPNVRIEDRKYTCMFAFIADHPDGASLDEIGDLMDLGRPRIFGIWEEVAAKLRPILGPGWVESMNPAASV